MDFKNKTKWCVITGAPSSGKTSVIKELAHRGYAIQSEAAREIIEEQVEDGKTLKDIYDDVLKLQNNIVEMKIAREMALKTDTLIFLDRGIPDSITYFKLSGFDCIEAETTSYLFEYMRVFIFDRLPFIKDNIRNEDEVIAKKIDKMLEEDYIAIGYKPVRVPVMSIGARTDFILENISPNK